MISVSNIEPQVSDRRTAERVAWARAPALSVSPSLSLEESWAGVSDAQKACEKWALCQWPPIEGKQHHSGPCCATRGEPVHLSGPPLPYCKMGEEILSYLRGERTSLLPQGTYLRKSLPRGRAGAGGRCRKDPRGRESPLQTLPGWTWQISSHPDACVAGACVLDSQVN